MTPSDLTRVASDASVAAVQARAGALAVARFASALTTRLDGEGPLDRAAFEKAVIELVHDSEASANRHEGAAGFAQSLARKAQKEAEVESEEVDPPD